MGDYVRRFYYFESAPKNYCVYAKYPDFRTHVRGLAKLIKEDPGNIQRELKRLEKVGFLTAEKQGNTKIYSTNKGFAIFKELQNIVIKSQQQSSRPKRTTTDIQP